VVSGVESLLIFQCRKQDAVLILSDAEEVGPRGFFGLAGQAEQSGLTGVFSLE
jgi:hypothetical protein